MGRNKTVIEPEVLDRTFFSEMPDHQFNCWLAGYFDGEGCIYIPKGNGIELSISSVVPSIIRSLHTRLRLGRVYLTTYTHRRWHTKYSLRVRTYSEAEQFLERIKPFLTIKSPKADEALARIRPKITAEAHRRSRNQQIFDLWQSGMSYLDIGRQVSLQKDTVGQVVRWMRVHGNTPMRGNWSPSLERITLERHYHRTVTGGTTSLPIAGSHLPAKAPSRDDRKRVRPVAVALSVRTPA